MLTVAIYRGMCSIEILYCAHSSIGIMPISASTNEKIHRQVYVLKFLLAFAVQATMLVCSTEIGECVSHLQAGPSTVVLINTKSFLQHKFTLLLLAQVPIINI